MVKHTSSTSTMAIVKWFHPQNWQQFHLVTVGYPLRAENTILCVSSRPPMRTGIRKHLLFSMMKSWFVGFYVRYTRVQLEYPPSLHPPFLPPFLNSSHLPSFLNSSHLPSSLLLPFSLSSLPSFPHSSSSLLQDKVMLLNIEYKSQGQVCVYVHSHNSHQIYHSCLFNNKLRTTSIFDDEVQFPVLPY